VLTRITKAAALSGTATLLAVASMTGALAHSTVEDDGVIDSGKETHAHDEQQHGDEEGHLDPVGPTNGLRLLSKTALNKVEPGKIADVGVLGTTAYLAAWGGQTCKYNGVHVVDIADLSAPKEIAFIPSKEGSYPGEGVQALSVSTTGFTGDILVTNNETCNATAGFGGLNIYDVTVPSRPVPLTEGYGDDSGDAGATNKRAHQIHSVFAWDAGARAYAVMVDNEEAADVDIVDITNPRKPQLVAEYDLAKLSGGSILQPGMDLDEVFLHDMVVKQIGSRFVMLASYWDGGYVQLDVTDPRKATIINDSDFAAVDPEAAESGLQVAPEGNAHQAEYTADNRYVLAADEDFSPYALTGTNTTDGTPFISAQGSDTPKLKEGSTLTGQTVFGGRACNGDPAVPVGDGTQIAVVERGVCTFTEKVANVERAGGYVAVVVFNRSTSDGCNNALSMSVQGGIPTFGVAPREQGFALFGAPYDDAACLAGDGSQLAPIAHGATGDTLSFSSYFDGWGYVHLYDRRTMAELDTYAIPEAHDPAFADGFGDLSVHEVATSGKDASLAYVSYYAGGLRVIGIDEPTRKKDSPRISERAVHIDEGGSNFWGVETFTVGGKEYVAASDRDLGLYLYEYTPVNAP
jgi:hypothetical protein